MYLLCATQPMSSAVDLASGPGQCIVLHDVDWCTYEALRASRESRQGRVLLACDRGRLTIVEVEATHQDPSMLGLYAASGVPEVWQYDGSSLRAFVLREGGSHEPVSVSLGLPCLPLDELPRWLERAETAGESVVTLEFLDWVRGTLAPRARGERARD